MCVFCDRTAIEHEVILSTRNAICIYNLRPVRPGHILILPIRHVTKLSHLSCVEVREIHLLLRDAHTLLTFYFRANGFNLILQEGKISGQSESHLHYHLIPRTYRDINTTWMYMKLFVSFFHRKQLKKDKMIALVQKLRATARQLQLSSYS